MDLSIGQRLVIGFGLLLVILMVAGLAIERSQRRAVAAQREYTQEVAPVLEAARDLEHALLQIAIDVRAYLIEPTDETRSLHIANVSSARSFHLRLGEFSMRPESRALYDSLSVPLAVFLSAAEDVARGPVPDAQDTDDQLRSMRAIVMPPLYSLIDLKMERTAAALAAMEDSALDALGTWRMVEYLTIPLVIVIVLVLAQSVRRPVRDLTRVATSLERGDWRPAVQYAVAARETGGVRDAEPRNELTRLARAFGSAAHALERRELRLAADRNVAAAAASSLSRGTVASAALAAVCDYINADVGVLYLASGGDAGTAPSLVPIASRALDEVARPIVGGAGVPGRAAAERRTIVIRDVPDDTPFGIGLGIDRIPPRTIIAVPLLVRDSAIGVLVAASARHIDDDGIAFAEIAGSQLGVGLENVIRYEEVQRLLNELSGQYQKLQVQEEELQAQNEEMQSQNEALQAQSEELQSQGEEIAAQNDQLREHTARLQEQADELERADQRKNDFLGALAHELRNPLAALTNSLFLLEAGAGEKHQLEKIRGIMERQTMQLTHLIEDLLDVTRISRGKIALRDESFDLVQTIRDCLGDHRALVEQKGLNLVAILPDREVNFRGDRSRIMQIVANLVDNAIKFSNAGSGIEVRLVADADHAELRVSDKGVGIEPEMRPLLFRPFQQAASSPDRSVGLGLGLSLVKALSELHGGSVEARSEGAGRGSEFIVRLPLARGVAAVRKTPEKVRNLRPSRSRRRVLIVDDNADAAQSLRDALVLDGHDVHVAFDPHDGIEKARGAAPEVILCDIGLPGMDGFELARVFRSDEVLRNVFLVAISGYTAPHDVQRAVEAGFDTHLPKPTSIEQILHVIQQAPPFSHDSGILPQ